jgi:3',5'-cyclic AMP phosphodiesterase CpdA
LIGLVSWKYYAPLHIHERNKKEISRIKIANRDDFSFAVFGDNKGNYSYFEPLLRGVDQDKEIIFAIDIGDLVSHGKVGQFRRLVNQVEENLAIPFLTATGNHDFNNGFDNYTSIFGPTYYAFQAGQCSFIVLDATNDAGFDKTQRQWLEGELKKTQDAMARFIFMHIPPFDPRGSGSYLPEKDRIDLQELFTRYKVTHLFASHIHGFFSGLWGDVPYTITGGAGARLQGSDSQHFFHHYVKVHVNNGSVDVTVKRINAEDLMARLYSLTKKYPVEAGLLLCFVILGVTLWLSVRKRPEGAEKKKNGEPAARY